MTPRETWVAIEARSRAQLEHQAWLAWHTAALVRAKKMPSLKRLIKGHKTRELSGAELERRREEKRELVGRLDLETLNEAMRKRDR